MKKPWSITTTLRNPERIRDFLICLQPIDDCEWSLENQVKYQIILIQQRIYGYGNTQFYNDLTTQLIQLINDTTKEITFQQAEEIFRAKNYKDPPMRGRQSLNPLKKYGFVIIEDNKVKITQLGKLFLKEDYDFEEVFFRSFLKWQLPNLGSLHYKDGAMYDIKPFIGTLHLIDKVNSQP